MYNLDQFYPKWRVDNSSTIANELVCTDCTQYELLCIFFFVLAFLLTTIGFYEHWLYFHGKNLIHYDKFHRVRSLKELLSHDSY